MAERWRVSAAVKASLVVLRAVFGDVDLGALDGWLAAPPGAEAVRMRARRYLAWLAGEEASIPPTARGHILRSTLLLHDRLPDRLALLAAAGVSSGLRQAARILVVPQLSHAPA